MPWLGGVIDITDVVVFVIIVPSSVVSPLGVEVTETEETPVTWIITFTLY